MTKFHWRRLPALPLRHRRPRLSIAVWTPPLPWGKSSATRAVSVTASVASTIGALMWPHIGDAESLAREAADADSRHDAAFPAAVIQQRRWVGPLAGMQAERVELQMLGKGHGKVPL